MPWVVQVPLQSTVVWASTRDPWVSIVPNRLSWEFFSFEVPLFGLFVLLVTLFAYDGKKVDGKFPCPVPRRVGRVFLCLVRGWSHSLWLWLDAGGPLPSLSWNGISAPRALLGEQAPVWCALSHHPSWLTQLSSCSWLWHEFPLCFGHLRFSFVVFCLIVGLVLFSLFLSLVR